MLINQILNALNGTNPISMTLMPLLDKLWLTRMRKRPSRIVHELVLKGGLPESS